MIWSHRGVGSNPNVNVLLGEGQTSMVVLSSPFASQVTALDLSDGEELWRTATVDRLSRPARMLSDVALFASHTGTLIALDLDDGEQRWRRAAEDSQDVSAISPIFIDGEIYTLTEKGVLTRYSSTGEVLAQRSIEAAWRGRRVAFVPMWRDSTGLSFLDQAGRLREFDLGTLETIQDKRITTAVGPGLGQLSSELLGGVFSVSQERIWTCELSGLLRASNANTGRTLWTAAVGDPHEMYSQDGRVLSVPILSRQANQTVLVVTRGLAQVFEAKSGVPLAGWTLPSPAVAPPIFDFAHKAWWILTESHLVALPWGGEMKVFRLPILERPYAGAMAGGAVVLGTQEGRVYGLTLPRLDLSTL